MKKIVPGKGTGEKNSLKEWHRSNLIKLKKVPKNVGAEVSPPKIAS